MQGLYHLTTFGCQMNVHESEKLAGALEELGYKSTEKPEEADIVVLNTCAIREAAEQKAFGHIGALKGLKIQKPSMIIAVAGCMTQQPAKAEEIRKKFPFVSIIFGTKNLHEFKNYVLQYQESRKPIVEIWGREKDTVLPEEVYSYRTSGYNAWVNITYGCNHFCSYCIVPFVRGRERSRNFDEIVSECRQLIDEGYKTITLLGQNVNSYGKDLEDKNSTFANLLSAVAKLDGDFLLSFMSSHPMDLTSDVIDSIRDNEKISRAIHLPVQSGSNRILTLMNRRYTVEHYMELIEEIKAKIPGVSLSTDIIVGFPSETEADFEMTEKLVKKVEFNSIFAFMYSVRKGTLAEKMGDQIPKEVKNQRVNRLLAVEKEIQKNNRQKTLNRAERVLIIGKDEKTGQVIGRADSGKTIKISNTSDDTLRFERAKITKIDARSYYGEIV